MYLLVDNFENVCCLLGNIYNGYMNTTVYSYVNVQLQCHDV